MAGPWQCEQIRATFFHAGKADEFNIEQIWKEVELAEPEFDEKQNNLRSRTLRVTKADGLQQLSLTSTPNRLDWILNQATEKKLIDAEKLIEEYFLPHIAAMSNNERQYIRLAFGALVGFDVANREEGYSKISALVPSLNVGNPAEVRDLLLQINRPHKSVAVDGISLNRLMRWSVAKTSIIKITTAGGPAQATSEGDDQHFARLELDINTDPETKDIFKAEKIAALFKEFVADSLLTLTKGERI